LGDREAVASRIVLELQILHQRGVVQVLNLLLEGAQKSLVARSLLNEHFVGEGIVVFLDVARIDLDLRAARDVNLTSSRLLITREEVLLSDFLILCADFSAELKRRDSTAAVTSVDGLDGQDISATNDFECVVPSACDE